MQLKTMRGIPPGTVRALDRKGIRTVESLAAVDTRRVKVPGVGPRELESLRRRAQRTIFRQAGARVKKLARVTKRVVRRDLARLESSIRDATYGLLIAARTAEERAVDAVRGAERQALVLTRIAADRTGRAAKAAQREYRSILLSLQRTPPGIRSRLGRYADKARFAQAAARTAQGRAQAALRWANETASHQVSALKKRGTVFLHRVSPGPVGRGARRTARP